MHFDPPELGAAASSAVRSPAPPPSWGQRPWSPTVSAGAMTDATTDATTGEIDVTTGATAAEGGRASDQTRNQAMARTRCFAAIRPVDDRE